MGIHHRESTPSARRFAIAASGLLCCSFATTVSIAQSSESVIVDVGACTDLKTRAEQLECYEDRVSEVLGARDDVERSAKDAPVAANASESAGEASVAATASDEPGEVPVATTTTVEPREVPVAARTTVEPREVPVAAAASDEQDDGAGEIVAIVTEIRELEPNAYLIHLDNDQVWRQNRPKRYLLRVGTEVHLTPTHWGPSYRLTVPDQRSFIQVERVR